jgi:competence protein ComGC
MPRDVFFGLLWTIIGITATIIVGYITIRIASKDSKTMQQQVKLSFIKQGAFSLYRELVEGIDGFEITYSGNPVKKGLYLVRSTLINSGNVDLDSKNIYKALSLEFPDGCEIISCEIVNKSKDVNANYEIIDKKSIELKWDLLKVNEFINLNYFVQLNENPPEILEKPQFTHRIANLKDISIEKFPHFDYDMFMYDFKTNKGYLYFSIAILLIAFFVSICIIMDIPSLTSDFKQIHYYMSDNTGKTTIVKITPYGNNMVKLYNVNTKEKIKLMSDELFKQYEFKSFVIYNTPFAYFILAIFILIIFFTINTLYKFYTANKKIKNNEELFSKIQSNTYLSE